MRVRALAGIALIAVMLSLGGCQPGGEGILRPPREPATGSSNHSITIDGRERTFRLYLPPALATPPAQSGVPLVVMLHGGFGSGSQAEQSYGWNAEADRNGFVVAYPDGLNRAWAVGAGCCGQPGRQGVNDVAFIQEMIAAVSGMLPIDSARVYATGISNGGMLSYRLACDTALFAAIGPVAGTQLGPCPAPKPISVIHIHGAADHNVPFDGRPGDGFASIDGPPVADVLNGWRATARCGEPTVVTAGEVTTSIATCPDGVAVELLLVAGAGHQWPGSKPRPAAAKLLGADPPSDALDATGRIWQFFVDHPRMG